MSKILLNKLNEIFKLIFDDSFLKITRKTSAKDIEEWDSLAQIRLIATIEKKLKLRFSINEITNLKNVGEMVDLIEKKKKK